MALLDKPDLSVVHKRTLRALLDNPDFVGLIELIGQREVIDAVYRQQNVLRRKEDLSEAYQLAGKIAVWEGLLQLFKSECKDEPGVFKI